MSLGVRDVATGHEVGRLTLPADAARLALPLGSRAGGPPLVAVPAGRDVVLWDAALGRPLRRLAGVPRGAVARLAASRDGAVVAGVGGDRIVVWDVATGRRLRTVAVDSATEVSLAAETPVAVGRRYVALVGPTTSADEVRWWGLVAGAADGNVGYDKLALWSQYTASHAAFSADGALLAVSMTDGRVAVYAPDAERPVVAELAGAGRNVVDVAFAPAGRRVAVLGAEGADAQAGVWDLDGAAAYAAPAVRLRTADTVVAVDAAGGRVLTLGDSTVTAWDLADARPAAPLRLANARGAGDPRLAAGGRFGALVGGGGGLAYEVRDLAGGRLVGRVGVPRTESGGRATTALAPGGDAAAVGLRLSWGVVVAEFGARPRVDTLGSAARADDATGSQGPAVAFGPDGALVAWQASPDVVLVWDRRARVVRDTLVGVGGGNAAALAFSGDGRVVVARWFNAVRFWTLGGARGGGGARRPIGTARTGRVQDVALSPDGAVAAVLAEDAAAPLDAPPRLSLVEVAGGGTLGTVVAPGGRTVAAFGFADGGRRLVVAYADGGVEAVVTDPARWAGRACAVAASAAARAAWDDGRADPPPYPARCARPAAAGPR